MPKTTRRGFVVGCSAAIAGMAGARISNLAFAAPGATTNEDVLVVVFLRGGLDGLNVVMPVAGPDRAHYEAARPYLKVPVSGTGAALPLDGQFGLHPSAAPLAELYQDGRLAIVQATGMTVANRSHFDSMEYLERGTPGIRTTPSGWLARHFASADNLPDQIVMPSASVGSLQATSLLGHADSVNMSSPSSFNINTGPYAWRDAQRVALRHMCEGDSTWLHTTGVQALDAMDVISLNVQGGYTPANGAVYPGGALGDQLEVVAQLVKLGLGLRVATVDFGGWDTHDGQGDGSGGYFAGRIGELASALGAFYTDLDGVGADNYTSRLTVVVQSEFGRRLRENGDRGTDHGHGNLMMVLGGNVVGGVHGQWPGLDAGQLFDNADLAVTTDFRRVLSEVLIRRLGNPHLGVVFPGYQAYSPLGIVAGIDLPPDYSSEGGGLFADGFESGASDAWSATVG